MKVFIKPWCPWCIDALAWLDDHGYRYNQVDVLADAVAYKEMRELSGQSLTPTLLTEDGKILADFDTRQLEKFLSNNHISP